MTDILIITLSTVGALFILLAAIGILRMPDLYLRMSVTTKAATLGVGMLLACCALYYQELSITTRVTAIIVFVFLTGPIGAHLIGRAGYIIGVPLWKKSVVDQLEDMYDKKSRKLKSSDEETETVYREIED
ncbi:MAG: monovalent cation/H(+) antiporter subunit G [Luteibaculaceae bacterium]